MSKLINQVAVEQWKLLYDLADSLKQIEPWNYFWDVDIIEIAPGGDEQSLFCSVMGRGRECYGVSIYRGKNGLAKFYKLLTNTELPEHIVMTHQDALILYWGNRSDLAAKDLNIIKETGHSYRGTGQWPYFRNFSPGLHPWFFSETDIKDAIMALEQLNGAISEINPNDVEKMVEQENRLCRIKDTETGLWHNEIRGYITEIEAETESCNITDELLIRRLLKKKRTATDAEFDIIFIPVQIKNSGRPYYPRLAIVSDSMQEKIVLEYPFDKDEDFHAVALWMLTEYFTKEGRPQNLFVRDEQIYAIIIDLCQKVEVNVVISDALDTIDYYIDGLFEEIFKGERE